MAEYPYIFGLFRSLEGKLLSSNDIERMVDAPNAEGSFRVFNDTEYADNLLEVAPEDFKKALNDDLRQTRDLYEQVVSNRNIIEFLFSPFDYHNIKLTFKSKYSGKDLKEEESGVGTTPAETIRNYVLEGKGDVKTHLKEDIDKCQKEFEKNQEPHYIDSYIDRLMFSHRKKVSDKIANKFISNFLSLQIDIANIKIFLRAKRLLKEVKWLEGELIPDGQIDIKHFVSVFEKDIKEALNSFLFLFDNRFKTIIEEYYKEKSLWKLERAFENYELAYLQESKRFSYGPEIAITYFYANKNALRQVRLIMTGKLNDVPPAEIRERLRNLW